MKQNGILRYGLVLLLPALLLGCTRMNVISMCDQPLPQLQHWSQVDVYQDIGEVPRSYQEIAVLEITSAATKKRMLHDIRRRAAALGANGIVLEQLGTHEELTPFFTGGTYFLVVSKQWDGRILAIQVDTAPSKAVVGPSHAGPEGIS